jgi:hypothetical protein
MVKLGGGREKGNFHFFFFKKKKKKKEHIPSFLPSVELVNKTEYRCYSLEEIVV